MTKYRIVIDTLGSDKGPEEVIKGAKLVLEEFPQVGVILVGDEVTIKNSDLPLDRVDIVHCPVTVTNYDNAANCLYDKNHKYAIFEAFRLTGETNDAIGMITAGCSAALMLGAIRYLLTEKRERPCLAAVLPNTAGGFTCLVDTGASVDCGPLQLQEFAHTGSNFMRDLFKIESPRVALLSVGVEPTKGNKLVKETYKLLENDKDINFVGNVEGNATLNGLCDVLVADGFAGNQVLKNSEGMAKNLITDIVKYAKKTGSQEAMQIVGYLMQKYDFASLGAGIMMGIKKPVTKCRGSSDAVAIRAAARMLVSLAENKGLYNKE